jgi:phage shock protein A
MDKMESKIAEKEAQADAAFEISGLDAEKTNEFTDMENKQAVDDEMARLKAELAKEGLGDS